MPMPMPMPMALCLWSYAYDPCVCLWLRRRPPRYAQVYAYGPTAVPMAPRVCLWHPVGLGLPRPPQHYAYADA